MRQWERERAAQASAHPLAARYPLGEEDPHGPVIDLDTFRERFAWPYSNSTRRAIAIRAAELLGTDQESVERAIARLSDNSAAENYIRSIRHATAEALLIGARGDFWGLPAFPVTGTTAREMAETWAELHDPEMSEYDRIELAHRLARFTHGYLNDNETLANLEHEGTTFRSRRRPLANRIDRERAYSAARESLAQLGRAPEPEKAAGGHRIVPGTAPAN